MISPNWPYLGTSPDSVLSCDSCGNGIVELTCPYCQKGDSLSDEMYLKENNVWEKSKGELVLKLHYYQVQTQIIFVWKKKIFCMDRSRYAYQNS